jgi:ferrochelatase
MSATTAILLLAHGTPNVLNEMAPYLDKVTNGRPMPQHVVEELQHRYSQIGLRDEPLPEGPPLTRWTLRQAALLEDEVHTTVYVGMRNWHPYIADTVTQMKADGVTHARVLCLAPQNSRTSTGLYRKSLETALRDTPGTPFTFDFIAGWADEPLLALAFAEQLWPVWAKACAETNTKVPVLFTAHSVPCRTIMSPANPAASTAPSATGSSTVKQGEVPATAAHGQAPVPAEGIQNYGPSTAPDPYPVECKQTAAKIADLLASVGLTEKDWFFAFQSQGIAGAPWIGPTVEDTLKALAAEGHKAVVIQPIGFLCDHVEILYDIDINFRDFAHPLGLEIFRPQSLNDSPTLIHALEHVLMGKHSLWSLLEARPEAQVETK